MKRRRRDNYRNGFLKTLESKQAKRQVQEGQMTNTTTEVSAARKSSTEQNGEHNRIRASGMEGGGGGVGIDEGRT